MKKLVCLAGIAFLFFLVIDLAGCATNSGNVKGGGTIVGNPEIPLQPKTTRPERPTTVLDDLAMLLLFRRMSFTGQLDFPWLDNLFGIFSDQPNDPGPEN